MKFAEFYYEILHIAKNNIHIIIISRKRHEIQKNGGVSNELNCQIIQKRQIEKQRFRIDEIPYTLKPLKYENLSANYKEQVYVANETFNLQGQNAILKLQFVDGELSQFLYAFHLGETYDEWFETQCDNLRQLYGEETSWNINYSSITKMKSQTYRWDLGDTTLQLIMMTGETINPSATLGIAEF